MMKLQIFELAYSRKHIADHLISVTPKIIEHLFYLMLDPTNQARNHWKSEIYGFLNDMDAMKGTNKVPNKDFIYKWTYGSKQDRIKSEKYMSKFLKDVCKKENINTSDDIETIMKNLDYICVDYFDWLSEELSTNEYVTQDEVYSKLDSMF